MTKENYAIEKAISPVTPLYSIWSIAGQIGYINKEILPILSSLEQWEQKEYLSCHETNLRDFEELKKAIMSKESVYNEFLYGSALKISCAVFIAKCTEKMEH